ncbi:MAG: acyltransferase family protein [Planctomycetota bacterium]|nr:acyltransferase family protein [Planctomycetota bacterium]
MTTPANSTVPATETLKGPGSGLERPRYHGLDALRAWAMFLGIVLHAGLPYMTSSDRIFWGIVDPSRDPTLTTFVLWVHSFRMELFYMISGFFSCMVLQYRDNRYFVRQRVKKLLVPFLCWWPLIMISLESVVIYHEWAHYEMGGGDGYWTTLGDRLVSGDYWLGYQPTPNGGNRGYGHLWFVHYLLLFVATNAVAVAVPWPMAFRSLWNRLVRSADWVLAHPLRIVLPAIVMVPMVAEPKWFTSIEAPSSIRPVFRYYTYYGCAYLAGYLLYANRHHLETLKARWGWYAAISLVGWSGIMLREYIHMHFVMDTIDGARFFFPKGNLQPAVELVTDRHQFLFPPVDLFASTPPSISLSESLVLIPPLAVALVMLSSSLALFGIALRYFNRPSPRVRYWSDSAYFLYVLHMPVTMILPSLMLPLPWHAVVKFFITTVATTGIGLVLYEYCIRYTFIGTQMNGHRTRPDRETTPPDSATA